MNLKNKVALISGAARIGITVAQQLAEKGCHVVLTYRRSRQSAEKAARLVQRQKRKALLIQADLSEPSHVNRLFETLQTKMKRLDLLVNMASIYGPTPFRFLDEKTWDTQLNANLKSVYLMSLKAAPLLKKGGGRIVNFSDWLAVSGRPRYKDFVPYYTAKMGVLGLTQSLALELAPSVLVNAIAPGPILPPPDLSLHEKKMVEKATPLRHWGGPKEIAKAVLFLCETDFVTGDCIRVDGGRHLY